MSAILFVSQTMSAMLWVSQSIGARLCVSQSMVARLCVSQTMSARLWVSQTMSARLCVSQTMSARLWVSQGAVEVLVRTIKNPYGRQVLSRIRKRPHYAWPDSFYRIFHVFMARSLVILLLTVSKYS